MTPQLRALTYKQWRKLGGCGLSHEDEYMAARTLGRSWEECTLGEIAEVWSPAGRELARFDQERNIIGRMGPALEASPVRERSDSSVGRNNLPQ